MQIDSPSSPFEHMVSVLYILTPFKVRRPLPRHSCSHPEYQRVSYGYCANRGTEAFRYTWSLLSIRLRRSDFLRCRQRSTTSMVATYYKELLATSTVNVLALVTLFPCGLFSISRLRVQRRWRRTSCLDFAWVFLLL